MPLMGFIKAAPRGLTLAVAMALSILCGLGVWQLQRLHWKEGLTAELARTQALPPVPIDQLLGTPNAQWRAVTLPPCPIQSDHVIYMHSQANGQPGYRALIACPTAHDAILVDLGFIADGVKLDGLPPVLTPSGRLRPLDKPGAIAAPNNPAANDWYWRTPAQMGPALGVTTLGATLRGDDFVVLDLKASNLSVPGLEQGQLIAPLTNRHLEYALTWFGLALTLIGVYAGVVIQRMRQNAS